jgi:hypothetical protein
VLHLPPGSYVTRYGDTRLLGSRLPEGSGPEHQLLSDEAVAYARDRLPQIQREGRKAEPQRLWLNMLSSQPLCFSLFGHLTNHREAGARVLNAVLPWPIDSLDEVLVEHAPPAAAAMLGGKRPDNSAFDAMLIVSSKGQQRILGVETKYTEPFTQRRYDKASYRHATGRQGSWFNPGAADLAVEPATNQLWRNLMLAQETAVVHGSPASVVVMSASHDDHAEKAVAGMKPLLRVPEETLTHTVFEDVLTAAANEPTLSAWATRVSQRYFDLALAEPPT